MSLSSTIAARRRCSRRDSPRQSANFSICAALRVTARRCSQFFPESTLFNRPTQIKIIFRATGRPLSPFLHSNHLNPIPGILSNHAIALLLFGIFKLLFPTLVIISGDPGLLVCWTLFNVFFQLILAQSSYSGCALSTQRMPRRQRYCLPRALSSYRRLTIGALGRQ